MPIVLIERYTRLEIKQNPSVLVVFGDNINHIGYGGQAAEARDEPNAVGIPTLWSPGRYFNDRDLTFVMDTIDEPFAYLLRRLHIGQTVWWPTHGVGTGLARLPEKAPRIMGYIEGWYAALRSV